MSDQSLRRHLVELLREGHAHITFEQAVEGFPVAKAGLRPAGSPHSAWELLEHMRIALHDIVLFSGIRETRSRQAQDRQPPTEYRALKWPDEYWPASSAPEADAVWQQSVDEIQNDMAAFVTAIEDPARDIYQPFPWGEGQTLLREALLIADHNAYHLGQLMIVRRMLEQT